MSKKSERPESISDGNDDDAAFCQAVAPVQRHRCRSVNVTAAVNPHDNRQTLARCLRRRPNIQVQAIFACDRRLFPRHGNASLHARWRERNSLSRSLPRRHRLRLTPAQLTERWSGERYPQVSSDSILRYAFEITRFDPNRIAPGHCGNETQEARATPMFEYAHPPGTRRFDERLRRHSEVATSFK